MAIKINRIYRIASAMYQLSQSFRNTSTLLVGAKIQFEKFNTFQLKTPLQERIHRDNNIVKHVMYAGVNINMLFIHGITYDKDLGLFIYQFLRKGDINSVNCKGVVI